MILEGFQKFIENGQYYAPANTPNTPLFYMSNFAGMKDLSVLEEFNNTLNKFLNIIDKINHYLFHPKNIWIAFYNSSYTLALVIGTAGIILAVMGWKKGLKITGFTVVSYCLIRIIGI